MLRRVESGNERAYCSSICRISTLNELTSRGFRCLALRGLSSSKSSSSSCEASKLAFLDCGRVARVNDVNEYKVPMRTHVRCEGGREVLVFEGDPVDGLEPGVPTKFTEAVA